MRLGPPPVVRVVLVFHAPPRACVCPRSDSLNADLYQLQADGSVSEGRVSSYGCRTVRTAPSPPSLRFSFASVPMQGVRMACCARGPACDACGVCRDTVEWCLRNVKLPRHLLVPSAAVHVLLGLRAMAAPGSLFGVLVTDKCFSLLDQHLFLDPSIGTDTGSRGRGAAKRRRQAACTLPGFDRHGLAGTSAFSTSVDALLLDVLLSHPRLLGGTGSAFHTTWRLGSVQTSLFLSGHVPRVSVCGVFHTAMGTLGTEHVADISDVVADAPAAPLPALCEVLVLGGCSWLLFTHLCWAVAAAAAAPDAAPAYRALAVHIALACFAGRFDDVPVYVPKRQRAVPAPLTMARWLLRMRQPQLAARVADAHPDACNADKRLTDRLRERSAPAPTTEKK